MRYLTTGLEVAGAVALVAAGWLAFGLAAGLAVLGGACFGLSYALTRGSE